MQNSQNKPVVTEAREMVRPGRGIDSDSDGRCWGVCNVLFLHLDDGYMVIHFVKVQWDM